MPRVAYNPFAQHILLILGRLEWRRQSNTHLIYVNTKRNELNDYGTRWCETAEDAKALIKHFDRWLATAMPGYVRININKRVLPYLTTPWSRRSLGVVDEANPVPRRLAAGRCALQRGGAGPRGRRSCSAH